MSFSYTLDTLKTLLPQARQLGSTSQSIQGIASLEKAQPGELSFLGNPKYAKQVPDCKASVILLPEDASFVPGPDQAYLLVSSPSLALATVCRVVEKELFPGPGPGIHPTACVDPSACVDSAAYVGPFCVVGPHAEVGPHARVDAHSTLEAHTRVGAYTHLHAGVRLMARCEVGAHGILHGGVVVGSDGYGYAFHEDRHQKLPQIGAVRIEDWVEIGANTTIDRGRFGDTHIGEGTKIDNLVQIAHNVTIGKHCLIIAQTGIAGSTHIEDFVTIGGQVGIAGHLTIGKHTRIGAQSGLNHSLPANSFVRGTPVLNYMAAHRVDILKQRLPQLFKRVEALEDQLLPQPTS